MDTTLLIAIPAAVGVAGLIRLIGGAGAGTKLALTVLVAILVALFVAPLLRPMARSGELTAMHMITPFFYLAAVGFLWLAAVGRLRTPLSRFGFIAAIVFAVVGTLWWQGLSRVLASGQLY